MSQQRTSNFSLAEFLLRWIAPLLVLSAAVAAVWMLGAPEKRQKKKASAPAAVAVSVIRPEANTGPLSLTTSGVAIPYREVVLAARVDGEVVEKSESLSPGHVVQQDQLLVRIDATDYDLQVQQWTSEVAKVGHELTRLAIDRANTQQLVDVGADVVAVRKRLIGRLEKLRNVSAASLSEQDIAELARLTAQQQLTVQQNALNTFETQQQTLNTTLELAKLQLRQARTNLERTTIRAPFSGVVIANHVEQNSYIEAGDPVATIEDTSQIEVRASLRREDLAFLQGGTYELPQVPVTVRYDHAGQLYCWSGSLSRQDGLGIDERTRTMPVRIRVPEPTHGRPACDDSAAPSLTLLRGMFVEVELHCPPRQPLVRVPESVIRPGKNLWILRDGRLHIEPIRIAHVSDGTALIDSDSLPDLLQQQIISTPVSHAREGLTVSLREPGQKRGAGRPGKAAEGSDGDPPREKPRGKPGGGGRGKGKGASGGTGRNRAQRAADEGGPS
ncbi:MAG: HlyD family efflux transporter periplasmic adaptor subunit [Planctomycetaceae bacterium]|nr:HlyD family efflux transporter periplasmic adaptor subunit [Planctomycetaceae bacterium]